MYNSMPGTAGEGGKEKKKKENMNLKILDTSSTMYNINSFFLFFLFFLVKIIEFRRYENIKYGSQMVERSRYVTSGVKLDLIPLPSTTDVSFAYNTPTPFVMLHSSSS